MIVASNDINEDTILSLACFTHGTAPGRFPALAK